MIYDPEQVTLFAKTDARGKEVPFGIKAKDRTRHVYVIGKTGMGKSTLLENMAVQDIRNGNGLAFIDPHGQTAETLLDYIPEERKDDVLYFAPFDMNHPVSFNVMEDVGPDRRHLVVSGLMSVFKKIWVDAWSARMEYILSNTLLALLEYPDSTLLGVNRMLSDKVYRKKVIDNIKDPAVKSFWVDEFLKYNERYMQEAGDAIKNKIGQFTANPLIRNIIGQPKSSFDIRTIMDERKILIMNLSKGLVGESNANLLGSMLTTRIYLAAMSRADLPLEQMKQMPNFYFYVDEFQSFANATFADILSEARKYKLNLTIAHQYIEQMEEEVRNAVFGNVGTIVSFRVGPFDAEVLETIFAPQFMATDIVNLGFAQIYLTLMIDGIGSPPFSATTLPPIEPAEISYKNIVIEQSRQRYAKQRPVVESLINKWHEPMEEEHSARKSGPHDSTRAPQSNGKANGNKGGANTGGGGGTAPAPDRANNDHKQKPERPKKKSKSEGPKPPQGKSLDELRSILKDIASTEQTKTKKKADATNGNSNKNESKREDSSRDTGGDKPDAARPATKADLRAALDQAIGQKSGDTSTDTPTDSRPKSKASPAHQTSESKSVTQAHDTPATEASQSDTRTKSISDSADADTSPPAESVAPATESAKTDSAIKPAGTSETEESSAAQALTNENINSAPPPAANEGSKEDPLNPKKLERMMRVNQSERSPLK